jgi:hypothetical protein
VLVTEDTVDHTRLSREGANQSAQDLTFFQQTAAYFDGGDDSTLDKLENFAKYVPRQTLAKFLVRYEIFKQTIGINGSIIECGVLRGAKLSAIFDPVIHSRYIIGFVTFGGFPSLHEQDQAGTSAHLHTGGLSADSYADLQQAIVLYDMNRTVGHIPKIELVRGDIKDTIPEYVKANPHLVVSLLYLDVDIYEPTKVALEWFLDRIPRGGIICFDELNTKLFPGETAAVHEMIGLNKLRIERFPFDSYVSYAVM